MGKAQKSSLFVKIKCAAVAAPWWHPTSNRSILQKLYSYYSRLLVGSRIFLVKKYLSNTMSSDPCASKKRNIIWNKQNKNCSNNQILYSCMIRFEVRLTNCTTSERRKIDHIKFQRTKVKEDLIKHGSNHYYSNAQTCNSMHLLKQQPTMILLCFWAKLVK